MPTLDNCAVDRCHRRAGVRRGRSCWPRSTIAAAAFVVRRGPKRAFQGASLGTLALISATFALLVGFVAADALAHLRPGAVRARHGSSEIAMKPWWSPTRCRKAFARRCDARSSNTSILDRRARTASDGVGVRSCSERCCSLAPARGLGRAAVVDQPGTMHAERAWPEHAPLLSSKTRSTRGASAVY